MQIYSQRYFLLFVSSCKKLFKLCCSHQSWVYFTVCTLNSPLQEMALFTWVNSLAKSNPGCRTYFATVNLSQIIFRYLRWLKISSHICNGWRGKWVVFTSCDGKVAIAKKLGFVHHCRKWWPLASGITLQKLRRKKLIF